MVQPHSEELRQRSDWAIIDWATYSVRSRRAVMTAGCAEEVDRFAEFELWKEVMLDYYGISNEIYWKGMFNDDIERSMRLEGFPGRSTLPSRSPCSRKLSCLYAVGMVAHWFMKETANNKDLPPSVSKLKSDLKEEEYQSTLRWFSLRLTPIMIETRPYIRARAARRWLISGIADQGLNSLRMLLLED
ncbi:hypothetical protein AJ80_08066 [Polytolypa hystricis UAMH7299]|uniref:Uncharacterized protein n=1 Tax=Polytolypa hystricis (strain UAMH7299) TaxID=1447883 RepID=A0A2B7XE79_POLH7|nr:hypothetical protein AJ80_08066 [Polytolypa hystricis UAMH7299]